MKSSLKALIRCDSESRYTGGVCIYVKDLYSVQKIRQEIMISDHIYWLVIKIVSQNQSLYLAAIYRSPNSSTGTFCDNFKIWFEELVDLNRQFIVAGDFNINWNDATNTYTKVMQNIIEIENMSKQIVKQPTRITKTTSTLIDYVLTDQSSAKAETIKELKISDHETITIDYEFRRQSEKTHEIRKKKIIQYNKHIFRREMKKSEMLLNNIGQGDYARVFSDEMKRAINSMVVNKVDSKSSNEWFNRNLMQLKRNKIVKYQEFIRNNSNETWNQYCHSRNIYKREIVKSKNNYINQKIQTATDQKNMWRVIKSNVLNEQETSIRNVYFNNINVTKNDEIADKFNKYFVDSIAEICETIPYVQLEERRSYTASIFKFKHVTINDISVVLKSFKNKKDFNFMSAKMILDAISITGPMFVKVINSSIQNGCFPETWKESVITPIAKVKNTEKCEEFRPINALPVYEKIIEKIAHSQLEKYLEENNILIENQSGFRKKHSCESAINNVLVTWKEEVAKKNFVFAVFLDLKRAFETIDRKILLEKLNAYGVNDQELDWFSSYLSKRTQRTSVNGFLSSAIETIHGVPQGSILGPLLFVLYINDIKEVIQDCQITLFADDALIFISGNNSEECIKLLQMDLNRICEWLKANKMKLNVAKSKSMVIKHNIELKLNIDNEDIENVEIIKYLGIIIDKNLKFSGHISNLINKISKKKRFLQ